MDFPTVWYDGIERYRPVIDADLFLIHIRGRLATDDGFTNVPIPLV
jgi:hypothetical protein